MAVIYTQTDGAITFDVGCSGKVAGVTTAGRELVEGGTPGVNEVSVDPDNNTESAVFALRTTGGVGADAWAAGDYVLPLNIAGSNGNSLWTATYLCERTAGGAFVTVGQTTGNNDDVSAPGVVSQTVTLLESHTPAGQDSDLFFVVVFSNSDQHGNSTTSIVPDQDVSTPIELAAAPVEGGSEASVTASSVGAGQKIQSAGAATTVEAAAQAGGSKQASGGSTASVNAAATGGGQVEASGGAAAAVGVSAQAGGTKAAEGGAAAAVDVSPQAGGEKTAQAGAPASVSADATGAGTKHAEGGSQATNNVVPISAGRKTASGSAQATVSVSADGAGTRADEISGGAESTVTVTSDAGGTKRAQGGAAAGVDVLAQGGGEVEGAEKSGGSKATVVALPAAGGRKSSESGSAAAAEIDATAEGFKLASGGDVSAVSVDAQGGGSAGQTASGLIGQVRTRDVVVGVFRTKPYVATLKSGSPLTGKLRTKTHSGD